jgi:hypothetical protein
LPDKLAISRFVEASAFHALNPGQEESGVKAEGDHRQK